MQQSRNFTAGVLFFLLGLIFMISGWDYPLGSMRRMGPGMFPLLASLALMVCAGSLILTSVKGLRFDWFSAGAIRAQVRPVTVILLAVVTFGLLIERAGIFASVTALVMISYFAGEPRRPVPAIAGAMALAAFVGFIFVYVLNIPLKVWP